MSLISKSECIRGTRVYLIGTSELEGGFGYDGSRRRDGFLQVYVRGYVEHGDIFSRGKKVCEFPDLVKI